jgi:hypothetical protein
VVNDSVVVGRPDATNAQSVIIGRIAQATGSQAVAVGRGAIAAGSSTAIGHSATTATYQNSVALGKGATCTAANQIMLGRSSEHVAVPGTGSATSTTTGALRVAGGIGVVENAVVGGEIRAGSTIYTGYLLNLGGNQNLIYARRDNTLGGSFIVTASSASPTIWLGSQSGTKRVKFGFTNQIDAATGVLVMGLGTGDPAETDLGVVVYRDNGRVRINSTVAATTTTSAALYVIGGIATGNGIVQAAASYHYFGDVATDGSWRVGRNGAGLDFDKRVAGSYVNQFSLPYAPPGAPVTSVFGRSGAVLAAASDYDASQVDNDSLVTGTFVSDALNTLAGDLTDLADTVNDIDGRLTTAEGAISTLQSDLTTLQNVVSDIGDDVSTLQGEMATIQGYVSTLQGEVSTLQGDVSTLQTDVSTLTGWKTTLDATSGLILCDGLGGYSGIGLTTDADEFLNGAGSFAEVQASQVLDDSTYGGSGQYLDTTVDALDGRLSAIEGASKGYGELYGDPADISFSAALTWTDLDIPTSVMLNGMTADGSGGLVASRSMIVRCVAQISCDLNAAQSVQFAFRQNIVGPPPSASVITKATGQIDFALAADTKSITISCVLTMPADSTISVCAQQMSGTATLSFVNVNFSITEI